MPDEPATVHAYGVRLTVAYDGTRFHGYQLQHDQRTVQGVLEAAVAVIAGITCRVRGAGRTDAGVHALGQVVAFDCPKQLTPRAWVMALNANLPQDVAVQDAEPCEPGYNPRFDALHKTYRYVLDLGLSRHPMLRDRAWHLASQIERSYVDPDRVQGSQPVLDVDAMRAAASLMLGQHDFRAFRAADDERENTIRRVLGIEIRERFADDPRLLAIEVTGEAFMKNMVRIITGTLLDVGRHRLTLDQVRALLSAQGDRQDAGPTAPACGLTLVSISLGRIRAQASR